MNVFVARQPIFNRGEQSVAYELLYRKSEINSFTHIDGYKWLFNIGSISEEKMFLAY
jgi:c-di-GMP-related signal transduction protein